MKTPKRIKEPLQIVKCKNCGIEFEKKRSWQEFCKQQCRFEYFWKTHQIVIKPHDNTPN